MTTLDCDGPQIVPIDGLFTGPLECVMLAFLLANKDGARRSWDAQ